MSSSSPLVSEEAKKRKKSIAMAIVLVVFGISSYLGYQSYFFVGTDNASVQGNSTLLSSRVAGVIIRVLVEENEKVQKGQVLAEIDPTDFQNTLLHLRSEMEAIEAEVKGASIHYERALKLVKTGAATQEKLDTSETIYRSLKQKLKSAQAQVAEASLKLSYTKITAPVDGKIARKSVEVGMFTHVGQPLFGFVGGQDRWVVANLKETDIALVKKGNSVHVEVDALSRRSFHALVESISPATGATFSLLPPDNATGNFTKVVQRIPVRIQLLNLSSSDVDVLQAGLSAEVRIKVR
jgi:membrane fusion protein (multidrug efflux system)